MRFFGGPGFRRPERNMGEKILVNYWRFLPLRISESGLMDGIGLFIKILKNSSFFLNDHIPYIGKSIRSTKKKMPLASQMFQKQYFLWPGNQGLIFCFPSRTCCMNLPLK